MAFWNRKSLVASAALVSVNDPRSVKRVAAAYRPWQSTAWDLYDTLAEVHYPANFSGSSLSRFTLHIGVVAEGQTGRVPHLPSAEERTPVVKACEDALESLGDHSEILRRYAINKMIAADGWLYGEDHEIGTDWEFLSVREIHADERGQIMRYPAGVTTLAEDMPAPDKHTLFRFWNAHPAYTQLADGPLNPLQDDCRRLIALNDSITSRLLSRLSQAGILFLPNSLTVAGDIEQPDGTDGPRDPFFRKILNTMQAALLDRKSAAGSIPIMVRGPSGEGDKIVHIKLDREIDRVEMELRAELRNTIATGMDLPKEAQTGMGDSNHWCKPVGDRAFRRGDGPVSVDDLAVGDEILALDHVTGVADWVAVEGMYRADVEAEEMIDVTVSGARGPSWVTRQTPAHRNPVIRNGVRLVVEADSLRVGDVLTCGAPTSGLPVVPTFDDDLVRLVAWYSADGTITGPEDRPAQVRIAKSWQRNPDKVARLLAAARGVFGPASTSMPRGGPPSWRVEHQGRGMEVLVLNAAARDLLIGLVPGKRKVIPRSFVDKLTSAQLEAFIDAWLDSDGSRRFVTDFNGGSIGQRDPERLDALEYAAVLSGRSCRRTSRVCESGFVGDSVMHFLSIGAQRGVTVRSLSRSEFTGEVWCPTTRLGTWLSVDEHGWTNYTGNSSWSITDSTYSSHLAPMADDFCAALTRQYLYRAAGQLLGYAPGQRLPEGLRAELQRIVIFADGSAVITRPNKTKDAVDLADRVAISPQALRQRAGATEDEAPTPAEYIQGLGRKFSDPYLATWGMDEAKEFDWEKVSTRQSGAPGPGGQGQEPSSEHPTDPGNPVGGPGTGDVGGGED